MSADKRKKTPQNEPKNATRVFLVDDHALICTGLRSLINSVPDLTYCGEATEANEALDKIATSAPDVVIVDISLQGSSGLDLIRDMRLHHPSVRTLALSMHDERLYAERALRAGASGYVMKQHPPERVIEAIRTVRDGRMFVSEELMATMLKAFVSGAASSETRTGVQCLSNRELEVFEDIGRGMCTSHIAESHSLSPKTVETYRSNIKSKLGLKNATELTHAAIHWVAAADAGAAPQG